MVDFPSAMVVKPTVFHTLLLQLCTAIRCDTITPCDEITHPLTLFLQGGFLDNGEGVGAVFNACAPSCLGETGQSWAINLSQMGRAISPDILNLVSIIMAYILYM